MINGREVLGMTWADEREFIDGRVRHLLTQHRNRHYHHLVDAMARVNPDLNAVLSHLKDIGNERLVKYVKGRIVGMLLIRYLYFSLYPQQFSHKGDLIFYANYFYVQQWLFRFVNVLKLHYGLELKLYRFKILKKQLHNLSIYWASELLPMVIKDMQPHYKKIMAREAAK